MPMLVSGNPGSGKSTLTAELLRRGVHAVDADEHRGLAAWMDADGVVVGGSSLPVTPELLADHHWGWDRRVVARVVDELGTDGVLLGIAVDQWDVIDRFDPLVLLELDADTQERRVADRHPLVRAQIRAGRPVLQAHMIELGAIRIDAALPTSAVADAVVALVGRG